MNELKDYDPNKYVLSLDTYQTLATGTAIYPGSGSPLGLAYIALKCNGEAGEFAEHVGKAMRDDGYISDVHPVNYIKGLSPERYFLIIKELGDILWYVSAAANELDIDLSEVANRNLQKLYDRKSRGTLRGSGDTR